MLAIMKGVSAVTDSSTIAVICWMLFVEFVNCVR